MSFKTYPELSSELDSKNGVMTLTMGVLRDLHGAGKLGVNVVTNISERLDEFGISHWPAQLPVNQWESVRLYKRRSTIGELISAILSCDEKNDEILRGLANNDSSRETLKKIRELVCD